MSILVAVSLFSDSLELKKKRVKVILILYIEIYDV